MQDVCQAITFGEAMLRLSVSGGDRLERAAQFDVHVAGSESNVAAALARLGVPTAWVGVLPDTPLGRRAGDELTAAGIDLGLVEWVDEGRIGLIFVEQGAGARPTAVWYDRRDSAFARAVSWPRGALDGVRYAVVSGITPALSRRAAEATLELAAEARRSGTGLCIDVNYRAALWETRDARAALEPLLAAAEVVVCSAGDAERVFGVAPDAERFRQRFAPDASLCVITCSEHGASAADAAGRYEVGALPTTVIDRLGMGDAFLAGLLSGLIDDASPEQALRRGAAMAALKATARGDLSLVTRRELDAALDRDPVGVLR